MYEDDLIKPLLDFRPHWYDEADLVQAGTPVDMAGKNSVMYVLMNMILCKGRLCLLPIYCIQLIPGVSVADPSLSVDSFM